VSEVVKLKKTPLSFWFLTRIENQDPKPGELNDTALVFAPVKSKYALGISTPSVVAALSNVCAVSVTIEDAVFEYHAVVVPLVSEHGQ
jgi:hypothetical protein